MRLMLALTCGFLIAGCRTSPLTPQPPVPTAAGPLSSIALPHGGSATHEGSWDRSGGNADMRRVEPGQTLTLLDHKGAGIIRRFWVTIAPRSHKEIHRQAILRMYWDGEENPSVECPIGDFFGVGFGEQRDYISLPLNETSGGYNCYWPMPFHKSARWTITNMSSHAIDAFYYNIDYTAYDSIPSDLRHFHAQWRRENPTKPNQNYTILETQGSGHFVGCALFMQSIKPRGLGFLEGDEMIYIDGSKKPQIIGTGTEDYFSSGWYFDRGLYSAPYHGVVIKDDPPGRVSAYRWHIEDAMPFKNSIRVTIEHGTNNDHQADYSSVAFYYQTGPHTPGPAIPKDPAVLLPTSIPAVKHFPGIREAEAVANAAHASDGQVSTQSMDAFAGDWSGNAQLFWVNAKPDATLTIPLKAPAGEYELIAHLTRAPDYAKVQFMMNSQPLGPELDLYSGKVETSGPISLGKIHLEPAASELVVNVTGKNEKSTNYLVGIDGFVLKRVSAATRP